MTDRGHELTDELLKELESDIHDEYEQAVRDMQAKLSEYLETFAKQDAAQQELLKAGAITEEEYKSWAFRHKMIGKRWEEMRDVLAEDMHHTNEIAYALSEGRMPDVYALNMNYSTYEIEHGGRIDTGFTLYDHDTSEYLLLEHRDLMPGPSTRKQKQIAANKDMQWNMKKIQSAVLQGVLQGESPYAVAKRLASVGQMNENASVRYARTMTTSAQNAGRYNAFRRAKDLGVDLTIEWSATLDGRTRHEHRMMHGQRREVDEPFEVSGVKILYPAQAKLGGSNIPQELIWNCRCTLLSWVKGFEGETVKSSPAMGDMSFEEWQHAKERGTNSDVEQFDRYKRILKSRAPKSFDDFLKIKYDTPTTWSELKRTYRGEILAKRRKSDIIKLKKFNTLADPMREVMGAGEKSNPNDIKRILQDLRDSGVEIIRRQGAIGYTPSLFGGTAGQFLVEEGASYSAWLHEYKHFCDDRDSGFMGYRVFQFPDICAQREIDAYQIEIDIARKLNRPDIVKRLEKLRDKEVEKYVGKR